MNTDDLRTLLKEAGRPVDSPGDPVPVIRKRARRHRHRQTAAVACTAVVVAGAVGVTVAGTWPETALEPAGPVAADTPPGSLGETPQQVGDQTLLTSPRVHREPEATPRGLYLGLDGLQANDLVRVRTICPNATGPDPVMLEMSLEPFNGPINPPPTPPGDPVPGARPVACIGVVTVTDFVVPAGWPRYSVAQVDVKLPANRGMKLEVAAYR